MTRLDHQPAPGPARVLVVEHDAGCPPALLGEWLTAAGATLDVRRPVEGEPLPGSLDEHEALLVLGGPQDADDPAHAWFGPTRALVREAAERGRPALGVCLGHQLAALALGGRTGRNPAGQQVGLVPVGWTSEAAEDPLLGGLAAGPARGVHWNDDVVLEVPPGAAVLARAPGGEVQALRLAPTVWGVQWHPEVDEPILRRWAEEDAERHLERGVDQEAALAEVAAAGAELEATWRGLATRLVALARGTRAEAAGEHG